jgi:hypothetical protein
VVGKYYDWYEKWGAVGKYCDWYEKWVWWTGFRIDKQKKHTLIPLDYLDNFFSHDKSLAFLFNFRQKVVGMGQK